MTTKSVPFSMIGGLERYPEFRLLVNKIAKDAEEKATYFSDKITSDVPYKKQFVIEEVIKKLQELV